MSFDRAGKATRRRHSDGMSADDSIEVAPSRFDVADHLNHPAVVRAFLWHAVSTGDADTIRRAEASIARAEARRAAAA